jgi:CheY-like chemotaxis protein
LQFMHRSFKVSLMNQSLLIVEDEHFLLELYHDIFLDEGYVIDTALDGQAGYEKIRQGGYDGILLDIMMPHLDALQILGRLQEHPPEKSNGPIILLTNLNHDPAIQKAIELGAHSSLVKAELSPAQLVLAVNRILGELHSPRLGKANR